MKVKITKMFNGLDYCKVFVLDETFDSRDRLKINNYTFKNESEAMKFITKNNLELVK